MICASCATASACTSLELSDEHRDELRRELLALALAAGAVRWEPYPEAVSWEQMRRDADARLCRWLRTPLGRLLMEIGGG